MFKAQIRTLWRRSFHSDDKVVTQPYLVDVLYPSLLKESLTKEWLSLFYPLFINGHYLRRLIIILSSYIHVIILLWQNNYFP